MAKRCDFCFQVKETVVPVMPSSPMKVCKACSYKINQVTGFLEYHDIVLSFQPTLSIETPPTPPGKTVEKSPGPKLGERKAKDKG